MKKVTKVATILLSMLIILTMTISPVFAATSGTNIGGVSINPNTSGNGISNITGIGNSIIGVLQVVGIILSVIILIVLGIKYMMGSAEEKAEYKKTLMPYFIGAVLIFAAAALAGTVYEWIQNL